MKKKFYAFISCLLCVTFLGGMVVFAKEEISVTNHIETGVIDIDLVEYQLTENGELELWEDEPTLLPGTKISKIPRIYNIGYDCYIRAKLDFSIDELADSYFGFGENWEYAEDGYWYYKKILKSDHYTDIFQGIQVPENFSQEFEGQKATLKIDVDAIQTNNFIPDYSKGNPWGNVEIEQCIHEGPYTIQSLEVSNPEFFEIQYDSEAEKLIKNKDDFFINFPVLFPGDSYSDVLELSNDADYPVNLYFRTYAEESDLLDKIQLKISLFNGKKNKVIYKGSLDSNKLEDKMLLTKIEEKGSHKLIYTITVPPELQNEYTLLKDKVRWMFSVESLKPKVDDTDKGGNTNTGYKPEGYTGSLTNRVPKTGDESVALAALVVMLLSGVLLVVIIKKSRKEKKVGN